MGRSGDRPKTRVNWRGSGRPRRAARFDSILSGPCSEKRIGVRCYHAGRRLGGSLFFTPQRNATLSAIALLKHCYFAYFSKPADERVLFRVVRRRMVGSIVEIGVGDGRRAERLIRAVAANNPPAGVRYAGIDLFEARPEGKPRISLKSAHRRLAPLADKLRLIPGDPYAALARMANSLTNTDLLIIGGDQDAESLARAWFYVPRMLHSDSQVLVQTTAASGEPTGYQAVSHVEIERLAKSSQPARRRAA